MAVVFLEASIFDPLVLFKENSSVGQFSSNSFFFTLLTANSAAIIVVAPLDLPTGLVYQY
jgi:hypothetical protein